MNQSLKRGLEILLVLEKKEKASITEIAEELEVNKSTISRLMETLRNYDMVQLDKQTKKYGLGFRILYLNETIKNRLNVIEIARPFLSTLAKQVGISIHLGTYNNGMAYILDQVISDKEYNLLARVGMIEPMHASAVGKCLLAYSSISRIEYLLSTMDYKPFTRNTITNAEDLQEELIRIRDRGYAVDNEEVVLGVQCIAAPIYNYRGGVRHCIGISGPQQFITEGTIEKYAGMLVSTSKQISKALGYKG